MTMFKVSTLLFIAAMGLVLAACDGGSGGSNSRTTERDPDKVTDTSSSYAPDELRALTANERGLTREDVPALAEDLHLIAFAISSRHDAHVMSQEVVTTHSYEPTGKVETSEPCLRGSMDMEIHYTTQLATELTGARAMGPGDTYSLTSNSCEESYAHWIGEYRMDVVSGTYSAATRAPLSFGTKLVHVYDNEGIHSNGVALPNVRNGMVTAVYNEHETHLRHDGFSGRLVLGTPFEPEFFDFTVDASDLTLSDETGLNVQYANTINGTAVLGGSNADVRLAVSIHDVLLDRDTQTLISGVIVMHAGDTTMEIGLMENSLSWILDSDGDDSVDDMGFYFR